MEDFNLDKIYEWLITTGMDSAKTLLIGVIIIIIGLWIVNKIIKAFKRILKKNEIDETLVPFLVALVAVSLKLMLFISVIKYIGVDMTAFIAALGAIGLAIGMALSGTLQNFAGGVILLVLKPFKVGDFIEAQGHMGVVKEVGIFNTILTEVDNKIAIVPNGGLSTGAVTNYTREDTRRVDVVFGISYGDDIDKSRDVIKEVIARNEKILKNPEIFIGVVELADSSVNLVTRVWTKTADYWEIFFYLNEFVKKEFDKQGITIPFPQHDVHRYDQK